MRDSENKKSDPAASRRLSQDKKCAFLILIEYQKVVIADTEKSFDLTG